MMNSHDISTKQFPTDNNAHYLRNEANEGFSRYFKELRRPAGSSSGCRGRGMVRGKRTVVAPFAGWVDVKPVKACRKTRFGALYRNPPSGGTTADEFRHENAPEGARFRGFTHPTGPGCSPQEAQNFPAKLGGEVGACQRIGDVRSQESDLRAAIITVAGEFQAVERLPLGEFDHGVGELNFTAGAARLRRQDVEYFRLQDIAARDGQV